MLPWSSRSEKKASRLEDLASALDAGLPAEAALASAFGAKLSVQNGLATAIADALPGVDAIDRRVLEAGERAGSLSAALRDRAASARRRQGIGRQLLGGLTYPAVVLLLATGVSFLTARAGLGASSTRVLLILGTAIGLGLLALWVTRRAHRDPGFSGRGVPFARDVMQPAGEIPYLEALRSLLNAGVLAAEAHTLATATAPIARVRRDLVRATGGIEQGRGLTECLAEQGALGSESVQILGPAEASGTLDDALERAATRQREVLDRRVAALAKAAGVVAYALAVAAVVIVVFDFYGRILGGRIG